MKKKESPAPKKVAVKPAKKSKNTGLKIAAGTLAGAAVGALAGVLLAPDSGKATRKKIADKTKKAAKNVKDKVTAKVKAVTKKKDSGKAAKK